MGRCRRGRCIRFSPTASVTVSGVTNGNSGEFPIMTNTCTGAIVAPGASCCTVVRAGDFMYVPPGIPHPPTPW